MNLEQKIEILEQMMSLAEQLTEVKDDPVLENRSHFLTAYVYDILKQLDPFKYLGPKEWESSDRL